MILWPGLLFRGSAWLTALFPNFRQNTVHYSVPPAASYACLKCLWRPCGSALSPSFFGAFCGRALQPSLPSAFCGSALPPIAPLLLLGLRYAVLSGLCSAKPCGPHVLPARPHLPPSPPSRSAPSNWKHLASGCGLHHHIPHHRTRSSHRYHRAGKHLPSNIHEHV